MIKIDKKSLSSYLALKGSYAFLSCTPPKVIDKLNVRVCLICSYWASGAFK